MKTWETLTMSRKEVPRAGLLKAALAGKISNAQGALALHLSLRQFQRVKVRFVTEGWDCSTVTHIVGLRPFMSQLLCEQVVGRGARPPSPPPQPARGRMRRTPEAQTGALVQLDSSPLAWLL